MTTVPYAEGHDYGVGIDSLGGAIRGDAVERSEPTLVPYAGGQEATFDYNQVESTYSLETSMGISASVSGRYGLAKASAKMQFSEESAFNQYSLFLVVKAQAANGFRQMRDVRLRPEARDLLANGLTDRFREQYGDEFVRGFKTGGEFFTIFEISTTTEEEKQAFSAKLRASFQAAVGGVKAKVSIEQAMAEVSESTEIRISTFQQGGDTTALTSPAEIVTKAREFARSVPVDSPNAFPYEVGLVDYKSLDLPEGPNWVDLQNQKEALEHAAVLRADAKTYLNNLRYIIANPEQFELEDSHVDQINEGLRVLSQGLTDLGRAASRCASRPQECPMPELPIPAIALKPPPRKKKAMRIIKLRPKAPTIRLVQPRFTQPPTLLRQRPEDVTP